MTPKAFVFLAALCVVNASVVTVNVFNDDLDDQLTNSLNVCYNNICDRVCRWLQLHGGICVGGHCKCNTTNTLERNTQGLPEPQSVASCNSRECEQRCRRLQFPGGACVRGRCKCDNFLTTAIDELKEVSQSIVEPQSVGSCDPRECEQRCRRLQFPGGACVNGRCKCDNFLQTDIDQLAVSQASVEPQSVGSCNPRECEQRCRRLQFPGGACVNGRCKCDNFLQTDIDLLAEVSQASSWPQSVGSCYPRECEQLCRRLQFPGGACVNGRCKCDNFLQTDIDQPAEALSGRSKRNTREVNQEPEKKSEEMVVLPLGNRFKRQVPACLTKPCADGCRRSGRYGGFCINMKCECY